MTTTGFIGLGAMGQPMAANLVRKGHDLIVYDIAQDRTPPLRDLGAAVAGSVAEVAEKAGIVVTMVPDSPQVEEVVLGPGGILESGTAGQLVMDMSTIAPETTDRVAAALQAAGRTFVDAPVGRLVTKRRGRYLPCSWSGLRQRISNGCGHCSRRWAIPFCIAAGRARAFARNWSTISWSWASTR